MNFSSQKETYDSYTPSASSSRTSINGVLHHRSSKETIQSPQGSISNFSVNSPTTSIYKDMLNFSVQSPLLPVSCQPSDSSSSGRDPSISDHKYLHSLEKRTFGFRNQPLSPVCTIRDDESDCSSTASSTPRQNFRSLSLASLGDVAESSPPSSPGSSRATAPPLITDPSPGPSPVDTLPPSTPLDDPLMDSFLPRHMSTESRFRNKKPETSSPYDPGPIELNQEGDGDDWNKMSHAVAQRSSRSPSIPGAARGAYPEVSKSVDDSFVPTVSAFLCRFSQPPLTGQSSRRYCLREMLTLPTTPRVLLHLTCQHRITLRHLHPCPHSLMSTCRTPSNLYPSRGIVTL